MTGTRPLANRKLDAVQLLRAVAALAVVAGHVISAMDGRPDLFGTLIHLHYAGGVGVDVFFLISGFIMVFASERMFGHPRGAADFLTRRLVRILPLYWGVTLLALALLALKPGALPSWSAIAASFAFIPYDTTGRSDGYAFPVVNLGWTLNYEMLFYVIFSAFIVLGRGRCVLAVAATMGLLVLVGQVVDPQAVAFRFWTRPLILEFASGMGVALLYRAGRLELGGAARALLIAAAVALYLLDPFGLMGRDQTPSEFVRVFGWGLPSALVLVAAVAGPSPAASPVMRTGVVLGDASYALYLLHPFAIAAMLKIAGRLAYRGGALGAGLFAAAAIVAACLGAVLVHKVLERPITTWLTRVMQRLGVPIGNVPLPPDMPVGGGRP